MVKLLLEAGADKFIKDNRGMTAFDQAVQQGNEEALTML
jgi:ankyrin repeat protein